uniref:Uncharacterized protein n=1 Tax=Branchiostoma floridae TaxID=7739 RepID=C3XQ35_BRAFL|eukprot:XP_002614047.1 hypothetical protein BRAFLDRAFT_67369 [Branchiostoma floridae]
MEKPAAGVNRKLQVARRPDRGPGAGPVKNWPPHRKVNLQTGWHIGNWKSDQCRCLYHPETRTAVSLVTGEDMGKFGLPWTAEDEPMFVDIDNVDFCVDPTTITCKDRSWKLWEDMLPQWRLKPPEPPGLPKVRKGTTRNEV